MLTGTRRGGRVLAASLFLLATAARGGGADRHDAEAALRLQHRRRLPARHLHAVRRLLAEARQGIRPDEGGGDRQDRRGPAAADGHHHLPREPQEARALQGDLPQAGDRRGADRRAGARAREGRQGRRLDRRRAARHRSPRRASADRDRLSARQPDRRRDDALSQRPGHPRRARQPRRHGARVELVHARERADAPIGRRPAAALSEVHRSRQQPRLLHVDAAREHEHEPRDVHRVVPADHVQPSPDRPRRHGDVRAAVPRPVQLQLRSAHSRAARPRRGGDAQPLRRGRQARRDEPEGVELLDLVERRPADDGLLPQHDRPADRDDRESDADEHSVHPVEAAARLEPALPDRAAGVALPAVGRLLGDGQLRGLRHRVAQQGELPLQHLPDGEELDRARQPRQLDGHAAPDHRGARRPSAAAGGRGGAAAPAGDEPDAGGGGRGGRAAVRPRTSRSSCATPRRATRAATSCRRTSPISRPRPSSSTRCSRPA